MNKNDIMIMTIPVTTLFADMYFEGFSPYDRHDYLSIILNSYTWTRRGDAEHNASIKQPIGYTLIVHPECQKVYAYQRASHESYDESRLRGKWSWGIGGHVNQTPLVKTDLIRDSLVREIREEINMHTHIAPRVLGYINDDQTSVGKVHFGILCVTAASSLDLSPHDPEIAHGTWKSLEEMDAILSDPDSNVEVEKWSRMAMAPLRQYLSQAHPL